MIGRRGRAGRAVADIPRDSLYVLDVLYDRDGGKCPERIVYFERHLS